MRDIRELIPQRPPILMVDGLESVEGDTAVGTLTVRADNCFADEEGVLSEAGVVEHIAPEHVDNLIATLTAGNLLLMTHALPGTNGEFHVNEQPSSYWIEKLNAAGFGLLLQDTQLIRRLSLHEDHMPGYFAQSALMFGRLPVKLPTTQG